MKKHSSLLPDLFGSGGLVGQPAASDQSLLTAPAHPDSFFAGARAAVRVAQCFSLIPVKLSAGSEPRFRWRSFRVVYAILVILAFLARTYMSAVQSDSAMAIAEDMTLQLFLCFIGTSFFMLGMRWRKFALLFLRIEKHSENAVGDAHPAGVGRRMWLLTVGLFGCALVEHVFDRFTEVMNIMEFGNYTSVQAFLDDTLFERPFWEAALKVFEFISYTYWAVLVAFNDLFTMLCAVYIAMRIANFNSHLAPTLTKNKDKYFWENARYSYDALARLTNDVDRFISGNILITFVRNLFYICFQLLYFLRASSDDGLWRHIYHIGTFGYVLMRTLAVSFFAASVNDQSKLCKTFLYSVSERSYCPEVHRLLEQAANDEMFLTGYNFFRITRSFILTVAGTMATYEVILLQIHVRK